jgi:uncharacterized protein YegJ (DUF2314 family)
MNSILRCTAVAATMSLALAACGKTQLPPAGEDGVVFMGDQALAMKKAFARARRELDDFLQLAESPADHQESLAVKVGLPAGEQTEYVWINGFQLQADGKFIGVINNEVQLTDQYKLGDRYTFDKSDIVDWTYVDNRERRMHGNYTLCALLTQEPPEDAAAYIAQYGLDCDL